MAFRLTKAETTEFEKLKTEFNTKREKTGAPIVAFNKAIEDAHDELASVVVGYEAVRASLCETAQGIVDRLQGEYEEKSKKWQEGDKGQAAQAMIDEWERYVGEVQNAEVELDDPAFVNELDTSEFDEPAMSAE